MIQNKSFISPHIRGFNNQLEKITNLLIIVKEYQRYSDLMNKGQRWIDNGLRVCSKVIGVPKDFRERGMALENELGRIINSIGLNYCLQVPIGNYQIADVVVRLSSGIYLRIEAKYISEKYTDTLYIYKNILEWSTKYREKPQYFYPFIILYLNYDCYLKLSKEDFKNCYRNNMLIATFLTLPKIIKEINDTIGNMEYKIL